MYDVKPILVELFDTIEGVTSSDQFPSSPAATPHITFSEANNVNRWEMHEEVQTEIIINMDVWHTRSTGAIAAQVNDLMASIGFKRQFQADLNEPNGLKRKTMRFRGVVDKNTKFVYQ